jgi:hypothetical protein
VNVVRVDDVHVVDDVNVVRVKDVVGWMMRMW